MQPAQKLKQLLEQNISQVVVGKSAAVGLV